VSRTPHPQGAARPARHPRTGSIQNQAKNDEGPRAAGLSIQVHGTWKSFRADLNR
jgi:hypothetical protein